MRSASIKCYESAGFILILLCIILHGCNIKEDPVKLLSDNDDSKKARGAYLIIHEGCQDVKKAVPLLIHALSRNDVGLRCNAASALGSIGVDARDAIPALIIALEDNDIRVRGNAALAIGSIRSHTDRAIPALNHFVHNNSEIGWQGVRALGKIADHDKNALPYLKSFVISDNYRIKSEAISALRHIRDAEQYHTPLVRDPRVPDVEGKPTPEGKPKPEE